MIEVVLLQDVSGVGKAGSRVLVKDGYASNYLLPRGLGALPHSQAAAVVSSTLRRKSLEQEQREQEARRHAQALQGREVQIHAKSGAGDKLYGSVTASHIASELGIDKKFVHLGQAIRSVGTYPVVIRFAGNYTAQVTVRVAPLPAKQ